MAFGLRRSSIVTLGIGPDAPGPQPVKKSSSWRSLLPGKDVPPSAASSEGVAASAPRERKKPTPSSSAEEWGPGPWPPVIPPDDPREAAKPAPSSPAVAAPGRSVTQDSPTFPRLVERPPSKVSK